ncbi:hypothetical protein K503DRAFT_399129 [Rhizopogon vinicolor AM-OR11-026]|uniref:DUF6533 domain-containing protein n=1 Tax=Rhizopogon vinicolor AM-OR11-026 TaxID=1314800 RepID=A0A1B7MR29_9AGAM|nr:hypothetical protein K503DRAFT_399129 [Rhizopogon vinicolor AM-OR11-026]
MELGIALLHLNYVNVAVAFLWVYDYLITISNEVTFIFNGQRSKAKIMYLICRYVPFAFVTFEMLLAVQPALSQTLCQKYYSLNTYIGGVILVCAECIFITRACALWGNKRSIVAFFVTSTVLYLGVTILILTLYTSGTSVITSPIPSVSCFDSGENIVIVAAYSLLVLAELALASFRSWGRENQLLEVLIHHNIFYFGCGVCLSVAVISTTALLQASYGNTMANAQVVFHALLVTKMHRDLWEADRLADLQNSLDASLTTFGVASAMSQ